MLALGEDRVRDLVKTIGLYRAKAKNIIGLSRALIERFGSEVPRTRDELETLPGVGRKTAMWCSTTLSVSRRLPSIRMCSVSRTAFRSRRARRRRPSRRD